MLTQPIRSLQAISDILTKLSINTDKITYFTDPQKIQNLNAPYLQTIIINTTNFEL